jgi:predicted PurR-regulated permease PerM
MTTTTAIIILSSIVFVSLTMNWLLVWYIRRLIQNLIGYTGGIDDMIEMTEDSLSSITDFVRKDVVLNDPDVKHIMDVIRSAQSDLQAFRNSFSDVVEAIPDDTLGEDIDERE